MITPDGKLNFERPPRGYPVGKLLGPDHDGNPHVVVATEGTVVRTYCLDTEEAIQAVADAGIELVQ